MKAFLLQTPTRQNQWIFLLGFVSITFLVSYLGAWLTFESVSTWYQTLVKPPLTPPDWVFGPVWTLLYGFMALAAWLVWRQGGMQQNKTAMQLYFIQLVINLGWSYMFFYLQAPLAAFLEILLLWALILWTLLSFRKAYSPAGVLLVPYLLWVSFAAYLNAGIWILN